MRPLRVSGVAQHHILHNTLFRTESAGPNAGAFSLIWTLIPGCRDSYDCWYACGEYPAVRRGQGAKVPIPIVSFVQGSVSWYQDILSSACMGI